MRTRPSPRRSTDLKNAGNELLIVFGASAMVDRRDVVPAGIARRRAAMSSRSACPSIRATSSSSAGWAARRCSARRVVRGARRRTASTGCLQRTLAGIEVTPDDVAGMGVGGLLMEIVSRPQPREGAVETGTRGRSRRWCSLPGRGGAWAGRTSFSRRSMAGRWSASPPRRRCTSKAVSVTVVTGHRARRCRDGAARSRRQFVHNPDYEDGLSTSLRAGLQSLPRRLSTARSCSSPTCRRSMPRRSTG